MKHTHATKLSFYFPLLLVALVGCALVGCTLDDDDRCAGDYVWSDALRLCVTADQADLYGDTASGPDTEANGIGVPCLTDEDCSVHEAQFCLKDPRTPDAQGICTVSECVPDDCTGMYLCCDCTSIEQNEFFKFEAAICVPEDNTATMEIFGCVCN